MTTTESAVSTAPGPLRGRHRRLWGALAIAVVLAGGIVGGTIYWHWRHNATDLVPYGSAESGPLIAGRAFFADASIQPTGQANGHRIVDLHRVTPRIVENTAGAHIKLVSCRVRHPDPEVGDDGAPCVHDTDFRPGPVDLGFPATEILYKITGTHSGTVRIDGVDVSYTCDGRDGEQHVGIRLTLHVKAAPN